MKSYNKVGEVFEHKGKTLVVVEDTSEFKCTDCELNTNCTPDSPHCIKTHRKDKNDVHFELWTKNS